MDTNLQDQLNSYGKSSSKGKYKWLFLIVLVLLGAFAYLYLYKTQNTNESIEYKTQKIKKGDLEVSVMATGNLEPTNSLDIGIEVSGTIKNIYVDFNDKVEIGQVLAKLDTTKLKAQVDSAKASLSIAKANLKVSDVEVKKTNTSYNRTKKMYEKSGGKYPSINDLDDAKFSLMSAQASYEAKQAQVEQAQYNLKTAEDNLGKAIVKSSIKGIVLDRAVEIGQTVAASTSTPTLFTVAKDLSKMELIVNIDEADVANIKEELDVTFTVDAYQNEIFRGKIKQVRLNPIEESGVVTYETVVSVQNEKSLLRPGMTASAKIITNQLNDIMLISNSALRFKPPMRMKQDRKGLGFSGRPPKRTNNKTVKNISKQNFKMIYTLQNGKPKRIRVRVLQSDGKFTGIESRELKIGDSIIISQSMNNG